jgi:hypothetical protein
VSVHSADQKRDLNDGVKPLKRVFLVIGACLKPKAILPFLQGHARREQVLAAAILVRLLRCERTPIPGFLEVFEVHTDRHSGLPRRRVKHVCRNSAQAAPLSEVIHGCSSRSSGEATEAHCENKLSLKFLTEFVDVAESKRRYLRG